MGDLKDCGNSGVPSLVLRPWNYGSKLAWNWSKTMKTRLGVHIFQAVAIRYWKDPQPWIQTTCPLLTRPSLKQAERRNKGRHLYKAAQGDFMSHTGKKMFTRNFKKRRYFCPTRYSDPEDSDASSSPGFFFNSLTIALSPRSIA